MTAINMGETAMNLLCSQCLCPPELICWNLNLYRWQYEGIWGPWEVLRSWGQSPHEWNLYSYERDSTEISSPFYNVRTQWKHAAINQEEGPHPLYWPPDLGLSPSRTVRNKFLLLLYATQSVVFCYSISNRLRQNPVWTLSPMKSILGIFCVENKFWGTHFMVTECLKYANHYAWFKVGTRKRPSSSCQGYHRLGEKGVVVVVVVIIIIIIVLFYYCFGLWCYYNPHFTVEITEAKKAK